MEISELKKLMVFNKINIQINRLNKHYWAQKRSQLCVRFVILFQSRGQKFEPQTGHITVVVIFFLLLIQAVQ